MALILKNAGCLQILNDCELELADIDKILSRLSSFDKQVLFLTRYAIMISAAAMEQTCKGLITDHCETGANQQAKNFLNNNFKEQALNVKYETICKTLKRFDTKWSSNFKNNVNNLKSGTKWKSSLDSLIVLRNSFAHGGKPTTTFKAVHEYFRHGRRIMLIIERSMI